MRSSVMDCAFNDRDLRVKEDVSDLKLDPLFWRRVLGKNYFFASYRIHPSAAVRQACGALSRQLQGQSVFVLGSVFVHGLCATNLSRESARHRRLSSRALRSTLPSGLPQPCLSQYIGRCQRSARLAHLRGSSGAPDQKGKTTLFWPGNGCRATTKRLCTRFDNDRSLFEPLSVGTLSLHQSCDQIAYPTRPAWTDSFLYCNHRWALPRRQRPGSADGRTGSLLHHGSWLSGLLPLSHTPSSWRLLCHPCPQRSALRTLCFPTDRSRHRSVQRSHWTTSRVLLAQGFPRQTTHGAFLRQRTGSSLLFPKRPSAAAGANCLPTLQDALAGGTVLQVDQAASALQALLRKLDQRSQNSGLDRGVRLRAGGDLEERTATASKFTQHFTSFKRQRI